MQRVITVPAYNAADTSGPNGTNATVVQLIGPRADRKRWRCINIGTAQASYGFDVTQVAPANGWPLEPAGTIGGQGGGDVLQGAIELAVDTALVNVLAVEVTLSATINGTFTAAKEGAAVGTNRFPSKIFSGIYRTAKLAIPLGATVASPLFYVQVTLINGASPSGVLRWRRPTVRKVAA